MNGYYLAWFGFWIFLAVVYVCDSWVFSQGLDGVFYVYKTDEEKEIQRLIIKKLQLETLGTTTSETKDSQ